MPKIICALILFIAASSPLLAAQYNCTWNTGSGTWETPGNWSNCNSTYPTNGADTYTATIDNSSAAVTTGSTAVTIDALTVGGTNPSIATLSFDLTVTGDVTINSNGSLTAGSQLTIGGNYANSGTFTHNNGTVTFNATSTGKTIQGTLTGTSPFYRLAFNGSGGGWTVKDAIKVAATNVGDTLVIHNGTVTLGDGDGDNLEVLGRFNIATTADETAIFQTATIPQGQLIILDMNQNTSPLYCSECVIDVGAPSGTGQGTFRLRKNSILRLNPRNVTGTESDTTIYVRSTGYLDIQGERWPAAGDFTDTGTDASPIDKRETKLCANATFSSGEHTSKVARIMTGFAQGKLYDISATTVDDSDCATDSHDSITINDASKPAGTGSANMLVSGSGPTRRLCSDSTLLITADNQEIGRYIRDLTGTTGYVKIVDSVNDDATNCSGNDGFTVIAEPDAFTVLSDNDDFKITDGIRPDDTFEIFDYAHVTAENGTACDVSLPRNGWSIIACNAGSEALIQYADICDEYGVFFNGVNGANSNEGVTVNKSRLRSKSMSIVFDAAANNTGGKGITNNSVSGSGTAMTFWSSNNNYVASNAFFSNTGYGIYVEISDNNTCSSNSIYNNGDWGIRIYPNGSDGNAVSSNVMYNNGGGIMIGSGDTNNVISSNTAFGNLDAGIGSEAAANTYSSNTLYANQYDNLYLNNAHNSIITSNICYSNVTSGQGISVNNTRNAILASNQTYNSLDNGILLYESPNNTLLSNQSHDNPQTGIYLIYASSGNILGLNQAYANGAEGIAIAVNTATTTKLFSNSVYSNANNGLSVNTASAMTVVSVNDDFGSSGANTIADIDLADNAADKLRLYGTTLASTIPVAGVSVNNAYIISRMHDGASGVTKIWGDYNTVVANAETPQAEEADKFNYADNLWVDSCTSHYYSVGQGAGTEDTNLEFGFTGGAMGGDAVAYAYKVLCTKSNCVTSPADAWDVYRNGTLLTAKATTNQQYTDTQNDGASAPGTQFKIEDAGTDYTAGAAYTFVAYKKSGDTGTQKTVTSQQTGDSFIVTAATSAEFTGQSGSLSTMTGSTGATHVLTLSGNLSGSYNDITVTGATVVNSGATLSGGTDSTFTANAGVTGAGTITYSSGSTFMQRVAAAVNFGTSSGNTWTFNDLKFENSSGTNRIVTIVAGTGPTVVNGTLTIGNATDTNTTSLQANTNDRILDINGNLTIASMGRLQASNSASLTIGGNFTRDGTLTHNSGTITFDDNVKTSTLLYSGTTTFYNLNILTGGKQMKFDNADQTNIAGTLTVQGSDCTAGRVLLDSDVNDSIWELNVTGSAYISYADVEDCQAIIALTANNSTQDNDSNTNWTINGCGAFTPRCSGSSGYPSMY